MTQTILFHDHAVDLALNRQSNHEKKKTSLSLELEDPLVLF